MSVTRFAHIKKGAAVASHAAAAPCASKEGGSGAYAQAGPQAAAGAPRHASHRKRPRGANRLIALALVFVLVGVALIAYPSVANWLNQMKQNEVAQTQDQTVATLPAEDLSAEWAAAEDFNQRVRDNFVHVTDPFNPDVQTVDDDAYYQILNVAGDGVMGQIMIPSIGVDLPIYHGIGSEGMQHGVGHMPQTSLPTGGASTHCVLAGHTGLPSARIFDKLDQLHVGDWFIVRVLGEDHAYRVTSTEVVLPEQTDSLTIQDGQDLMTLVTCTPYGVNSHRLLVHAQRCDVPQEWLDRNTEGGDLVSQTRQHPELVAIIACEAAPVIGLLVALFLRRRKRKRAAATDSRK